MSRRAVVWSELQPELVTLIAERLGTRIDTFNFRLVCKQWRASTSFCARSPQNHLSSLLPFKFSLSENNAGTRRKFKKLVLVPNSVFLIRTSLDSVVDPWLCTVEELHPGKLLLNQPFSKYPKAVVPNSLNLSLFKVKEVFRFYTIKYLTSPIGSQNLFDGCEIHKIVLIADPNCKTNPTIDDHKALALVHHGILKLISIKDRKVFKVKCRTNKMYDDVVNFKGSVFAIDRKGRADTMAYDLPHMNPVVWQPVGEGVGSDRKKRLAVSCSGELYLIHRCPPYIKGTFKLYKLNEKTNKWDEVNGIGGDRILISAYASCYFVETKDFPGLRGNCMLFRKGDFPEYSDGLPEADKEIFGPYDVYRKDPDVAVFHFDNGEFKTGYSSLFWPLPKWLASDTKLLKGATIREIEILRDFCNRVASRSKEVEASVAMLGMKYKNKDKQGPIIIDIDPLPELTPEDCGSVAAAQGTFEGVNVRSDFIPVLQKIWEKFGNLTQESVVRSDSLLTWALESIAKMVIILQTNSNKLLNDSQAAFLRTTQEDLQRLHIKLDWLLPVLDTALAPKN